MHCKLNKKRNIAIHVIIEHL